MKKLVSLFLITAALAGAVQTAFAEDNVTVNINGVKMDFDVEPIVENGRTLVPFRAIFEALGCAVGYYASDGVQTVSAHRGNDSLMLNIGKNSMYFDSNEIELDVPAKIVEDRTLVPLRAVSEAFDTEVIWLDDINTVCLYPKRGAHSITPVTVNKDIKNEDGVTLINISCSYPVIESYEQNEYIDRINDEYKKAAESFLQEAESNREAAQLQYEQTEGSFQPYEIMRTYTVNTDRNGLLSITDHDYSYMGGAHGMSIMLSRNFNLTDEKELKLDDILTGSLDDEIYQLVYSVFVNHFEAAAGDGFNAEWAQQIESEIENVKYYLKDDSLVLYFDVYQAAPYAFGTPCVEIPYNENIFRIELKDTKLDEYSFEFECGSGYQWHIVSADSERLGINETTENGKYSCTVKGLKKGNTTLELAYIQNGKFINDAEKALTVEIYVDKDNKITILDTDDNVENIKIHYE